MNDLQGLDIVITRPLAQAEQWAESLQTLGATTHIIPLLEIIPVQNDAQIRAIKNCILDFDLYKKAIFVSKNAVEHGFDWLENYWPQLPMGVDFYAVGETTAKQLSARGVTVTDLAQIQSGAMNSEVLLQAPGLQEVAGEKIIIFRGVGGRAHLGETLQARGAQVSYCELYERRQPVHTLELFVQLLQQYGQRGVKPCVVVVHSGEAQDNLHEILQKIAENKSGVPAELLKIFMQKMVLLVPGARIFEQAQAAGFERIFAAQNATDASMLQGLMDLKRNLTTC